LAVELETLEQTEDDRLAVVYRLSDGAGAALDAAGHVTRGVVQVELVLAVLDEGRFVSLLTRTEDANGDAVEQPAAEEVAEPEELEQGTYRYVTAARLPEDGPADPVIRVGAFARREIGEDVHRASAVLDLRLSGEEAQGREVVVDERCDTCHGALTAHGGERRGTPLCIACHTPQAVDPSGGASLDFGVLVHGIHARGHFPRNLSECATCHAGAAQQDRSAVASLAVCTSCHDQTAFDEPPPEGMELHSAGAREEDTCTYCHAPQAEWSVPAVHRTPAQVLTEAGLLEGLQLELVGVTGLLAGQSPEVTFSLTDAGGAGVTPDELDGLRAAFAGPAQGPSWSLAGQDLSGATENPDGTFTAVVEGTLPPDLEAGQAILVGLEGGRTVSTGAGDDAVSLRETAFNPVASFLAGADGEPGEVGPAELEQARCDRCHGAVAVHGRYRRNVQSCALCHLPGATDAAQRPPAAGDPESVELQLLIHRIHRGQDLWRRPYVVYGFGSRMHEFGDARFADRLSDCATCHAGTRWQAPSATTCGSCHDRPAATAHFELNTSDDALESCQVCHGVGRDWDVEGVHDAAR